MKIVFLFCCVFSVYSVSGETVILDHFSPKVSFLNSKKRMEITPEGGGHRLFKYPKNGRTRIISNTWRFEGELAKEFMKLLKELMENAIEVDEHFEFFEGVFSVTLIKKGSGVVVFGEETVLVISEGGLKYSYYNVNEKKIRVRYMIKCIDLVLRSGGIRVRLMS